MKSEQDFPLTVDQSCECCGKQVKVTYRSYGELEFAVILCDECQKFKNEICECDHSRTAHVSGNGQCTAVESGGYSFSEGRQMDPDYPCDCEKFVFWKVK